MNFICGLIHYSLYSLVHQTIDGKDIFFIEQLTLSNELPASAALNTTPEKAIIDLIERFKGRIKIL